MFHDMSFLKQPRRAPPKPLSRRRESENKRGEREREDISAFFLHKSLPDRYDVQGRKQPVKNRHSGHDGTEDGDHSERCERQHAQRQPTPSRSDLDHRLAQNFADPPQKERTQGKESARISWSTSSGLTGLKNLPESSVQTLSSTPVRIRGALAQSGIFDNTGIVCGDSFGYRGPGFRAHSKDASASARSPTESRTPGKIPHTDPAQSVLVVRYQDRGTMVDEKLVGSEDDADHPPTQVPCSAPEALVSDTARPVQSMDMSSAELALTEASTGLCGKTITSANPLDAHMDDKVTQPSEGASCLQAVPERPTSPKRAIIERLEAAAEDLRSSCFLPPTQAQPQRSDKHSSQSAGTASYRPFNSNLAPTSFFPYVPVSNHDRGWFSSEPVLTRFPKNKTPLGFMPSWSQSQSRTTVNENHTPLAAAQCNFPDIVDYVDQTSRTFPIEVKSNVTTAQTPSMSHNHSHEAQQSMKTYNTEMEDLILNQTEEADSGESSPTKGANNMLSPDLADYNNSSGQHKSAHHQSQVGQAGEWLWQGPDRASSYTSAAIAKLEEDEEQRFLTSFWRPNGNHI